MSNREFSVAEVFPVSPPQWFKDCLDEMRYLRIMEEGVIKEIFREGGLKIAFTDEEFETVLWPRYREKAMRDIRAHFQAEIDALNICPFFRSCFEELTKDFDRSLFYGGIPTPRGELPKRQPLPPPTNLDSPYPDWSIV